MITLTMAEISCLIAVGIVLGLCAGFIIGRLL
jgi:hypothetical protein